MRSRTDILLARGSQYLREDEKAEGEQWSQSPEELAGAVVQQSDHVTSMSFNADEGEVSGKIKGGSEVYIEPEDSGYGIVFLGNDQEYFVGVDGETASVIDAIERYMRGEIEPVQ